MIAKPFASALALLLHFTASSWAVSVVPGSAFRSNFDLSGVVCSALWPDLRFAICL